MNINKNSDLAIINLLILLAYADDNFSEPEEKFIVGICDKLDISLDEFDSLREINSHNDNSLVKNCKNALALISENNLREKAIELLSELAAADHIIHENELLVLQMIAEEWGMYRSA